MSARGVRRKVDQDDSPQTQRPVKRTRKVDNFENLDKCQKLFDAIRSARDEDGRMFSDSFMKGPSRRSHPDYYKAVEKPVDLQRIQQKLRTEECRSFTEFCKDIELLISNAKSAYKEDSNEYKDVDAISDVYYSERVRLTDLRPSTSNATSAGPAAFAVEHV
ncbi:polybromo, partial [Aphelenchoides avenae]